MPSAANGEVEKHASITVDSSPIRRVVEILQGKIACLERQKNKLSSGKDVKSGKDSSDQKGNSAKAEEISQMLEFVWDLCKQAMGIAVLSENEAKKQARKESALRKAQDTQLVRDVLLVLDCLEQLNDPMIRSDFLSGSCGASQLTENDLRVLDNIYPEVTPKHCPEEGTPFEDQTMSAAKHLVAIIDGSPKEIVGTTYAHIRSVVSSVHECGYLDNPKELRVEEPEEEIIQPEEELVEPLPVVEYVQPPVQQVSPIPAPPPPAAQAVPAPAFPLLPPSAPPVTLQQVEHAYFAQQYGHQQKPPIPEVFGPQSFIFLQESEIDTPEPARQQSPRPISPMPIPSQTFTNQNFTIPAQHFTPELGPNPHLNLNNLPQPTVLYQSNINEVPPPPSHIPGFPTANPPPPIPMPPSHPSLPHVPHQPQVLPQPRLPSPSFQQTVSYNQAVSSAHSVEEGIIPPSDSSQEDTLTSSPEQRDADYVAWNEGTTEDTHNHNVENLEINEWNPSGEHGDQDSESHNHNDGQSASKFRPRGRGRGAPPGYRRGYQNGGRSGTYYRNNEGYQGRESNGNGGNYNDNYRDNNRYENYQQGYKGGRGSTGSRGARGEGRGNGPRSAARGGPSRGGPARAQFPRKTGNQYESRGGADTKQYAH